MTKPNATTVHNPGHSFIPSGDMKTLHKEVYGSSPPRHQKLDDFYSFIKGGFPPDIIDAKRKMEQGDPKAKQFKTLEIAVSHTDPESLRNSCTVKISAIVNNRHAWGTAEGNSEDELNLLLAGFAQATAALFRNTQGEGPWIVASNIDCATWQLGLGCHVTSDTYRNTGVQARMIWYLKTLRGKLFFFTQDNHPSQIKRVEDNIVTGLNFAAYHLKQAESDTVQ